MGTIIDIDRFQKELHITHLKSDEAECVVLAWLLKTKMYLIGETSHLWSVQAKDLLRHELEVITETKLAEDWEP